LPEAQCELPGARETDPIPSSTDLREIVIMEAPAVSDIDIDNSRAPHHCQFRRWTCPEQLTALRSTDIIDIATRTESPGPDFAGDRLDSISKDLEGSHET
jgi:hypothetical protein